MFQIRYPAVMITQLPLSGRQNQCDAKYSRRRRSQPNPAMIDCEDGKTVIIESSQLRLPQ
jgi:hypothetical protein